MTAIQIIINICLILTSIVLVASVLMQSGDSDGVSALTGGGSETFFGKNKNSTKEAKLALATKISAGVFVALALIMLFVS